MSFWWAGVPRTFEFYKTLSGQGANSVAADPLFVSNDPANPDFSLRPGSPIMDTGTADLASGTLSPGCDGGSDTYCTAAPEPGSREYVPE